MEGRAAGRPEPVNRLARMAGRLAEVARRVAAADAAAGGPPAGEWSARENVAHLVAVERAVWQARLDGLAALPPGAEAAWTWTEPGPTEDPAAAGLEGALALFAQERRRTLDRVAGLDDAGWARTGIHQSFGRLDVAGLLRVAADHDDEHIATMTAGRSGLG